jgi:hypothetical protein
MPTFAEAKGSRFLKSSDVTPSGVVYTIKGFRTETNFEKSQVVMYFQEVPKGLALNSINCDILADIGRAAGLAIDGSTDFNVLAGLRVVVWFDSTVMFKGERKGGIRLREPNPQSRHSNRRQAPPPQPTPWTANPQPAPPQREPTQAEWAAARAQAAAPPAPTPRPVQYPPPMPQGPDSDIEAAWGPGPPHADDDIPF